MGKGGGSRYSLECKLKEPGGFNLDPLKLNLKRF